MLDLQEHMAKVQSATAKLRRRLVDDAAREYFAVLDLIGSPGTGDFEAAQARANMVLKQKLLAADSVALIDGGKRLDNDDVALLALGFDGIAKPLRIPGPVMVTQTKAITIGLAAVIGAVAGMLILAPLMYLAFQMRDLGLVLGGPLGALLSVLVVHWLARVRVLTRILPWLFVRPKALRGPVRSGHEKAVRASVEQWVDWAIPMLMVLCFHSHVQPRARTDWERALRRISRLIYTLDRAPAESLPVVAHELIQEAKNAGFEGLEGPPAFLDARHKEEETMTWRPDLQTKYETFGHIAEGDPVTVERPAVILGGEIVQRGLVRKVRDTR